MLPSGRSGAVSGARPANTNDFGRRRSTNMEAREKVYTDFIVSLQNQSDCGSVCTMSFGRQPCPSEDLHL